MKTHIVAIIPLIIALVGCAPDQGDFKYIAKQPAVKLTILSHKFEPATADYLGSHLKVSGVAQEKEPFPVTHYELSVIYEAQFGSEKSYKGSAIIEMKDGKGSFENSFYLSDFPAAAKGKTVSFVLIKAGWFPETSADVEIATLSK